MTSYRFARHGLEVLTLLIGALVAYLIIGTVWIAVTVPSGAATQMLDGHCYRYESRSFGPIQHIGSLYWDVACG